MSLCEPMRWEHPDGRKIEIYPTRKERFGYFGDDQWKTLHRATVPNLTDEEWYASPGPEWQNTNASA